MHHDNGTHFPAESGFVSARPEDSNYCHNNTHTHTHTHTDRQTDRLTGGRRSIDMYLDKRQQRHTNVCTQKDYLFFNFPLTVWLSHTLTHTHTQSHTLSHTYTHSHTLTHTHTHSHTLAHTNAHTHSL